MLRISTLAALAALALLARQAQASPVVYIATLSGAAEAPSNASPGTGTATVTVDTAAHTIKVDVVFTGLLGNTTAAHIHCCTAAPGAANAGVATLVPTFTAFPLGVTSGTYDRTFDDTVASTWNAAFIAGNGGSPLTAEAALASGLAAGTAYLNIHTSAFAGGEIRGFLTKSP